MEQWKDIKGMEGKYQISNYGYVRSFIWKKTDKGNPRIMDRTESKNGYLYNTFNKTKIFIHRLVAIHFIDNPNNYNQINHKDGNKLNNNVDNLEWVSCRQNIVHYHNRGKMTGIEITKWGTYKTKIHHNKKQVYLGSYRTFDEAYNVRQKYIQEHNII
jgi:hypothetical protein